MPSPVRSQNRVVECVACEKCKCTWFMQNSVNRYAAYQTSITQPPTSVHNEADFFVLVCAGCGNVVLPPLESFQNAKPIHKLYDEMAHEITGSREVYEQKVLGATAEKKVNAATTWSQIPQRQEE